MHTPFWRALILFTLALLLELSAHAQPANNNFASAWIITGTAITTNGSNVNATKESGEPNHAGNTGGRSVWFSWIAPVSGLTQIDTSGSSFNTLLGVYTGSAVNALTTVASNNDSPQGGTTSLVQFQAVQGTTYQIAVDANRPGFQTPTGGNYILHLLVLPVIIAPTNGAIALHGNAIPFSFTTNALSPPIRIELYSSFGTGIIGTNSTPPYDIVVTNAPLGIDYFAALVWDSAGRVFQTPVIGIYVLDVGVTIIYPSDGATILNTDPLPVAVTPYLTDFTMTEVDFYVDGHRFAQLYSSPWTAVWTNVAPGLHRLTASGYDNDGGSYLSAPVFISVANPLVQSNSVWKYLDNGSNQGTNWITPNFDDSTWASGPAPLGYSDSGGRFPLTTNSFGTNANNKYTTTYYRQSFVVTNAESYTNLQLDIQRDDGAIVYLNGVEVGRFNMTNAPVTYTTFASTVASDDGTNTFTTNVSPALLVNGTNVVAVEIHQSDLTSTDIWFVMDLLGIPPIIRNLPPSISLTNPASGAFFLAPTEIALGANAADLDGMVTNVEFFADNIKVGATNNTPYGVIWNAPSIGWHALTAAATDDQGARTVSAPVPIAVYDAVGTPLVQLTAPGNGALFIGPANVTITANASAPAGITNVQFLANDAVIGNAKTSPYTIIWTNASYGTDVLTAVAFDSQGLVATSAVMNIIVRTNDLPFVSLNSPADGAAFLAPANITLNATASDRQGVAKVEFYANGVRLAQDTTSPYSFAWNGVATNSYQLWAVATDVLGLAATSSIVNITVTNDVPPTVSISSPTNGASFVGPVNIPISAAAADIDGTVTNVAFYAGTTLLGQARTNPFTFTWTNATAGTSVLTAVAFDSVGLRTTSAPVSIIVILTITSQWVAFNDQGGIGNANDTSYTAPSLGIGASSGLLKNIDTGASLPVTLTITNVPGLDIAGTMSPPAAGTPAYNVFNGYIDWTASNPGIHIYPTNTIGYLFSGLDPAKQYKFIGTAIRGGTAQTTGNEYSNRWTRAQLFGALSWTPAHSANVVTASQFPADLTGNQAAWNAGVNHTATSGDIIEWDNIVPAANGTFTIVCTKYSGAFPGGSAANGTDTYPFAALRLEEFASSGPFVGITGPANGTLVVLPTNLVIKAVVARFPGTVTNVAFYNDVNKLADIPSSPYNFSWTDVAPGSYTIRAIGSDDTGLSVTSAPVNITVQSNMAPSIAIISPANNAFFTAPADVPISVAPNDSDGVVTNVQFYANGLKIGGSSSQPFNFTWLNVPTNTYDLTAVAIDNFGASATSSVVHVSVIQSTAPTVDSFFPAAGVLNNLTQITVTFTEPVDGVNAADLLINNTPATSVIGSDTTYTFSFPLPAEGLVTVSWAANHGIIDREAKPLPFNGTRTNEIIQYIVVDTVPPVITDISPVPGGTLTSLTHVELSFSKPVGGVNAADLLINGVPATTVTGSLAGPYLFAFGQPASGLVQFTWAANHGIHDFAATPNVFAAVGWSYTLNPAVVESAIVINEIYYHPPSGNMAEEWVELFNNGAAPVDLTDWHLHGTGFDFPNVTIPAGGYLVVAADVPTFTSKHPGVNNVVGGGWSEDVKKHLQLADPAGNIVSDVAYAKSGDWGERLRGSGEIRPASITHSGSTATVTWDGYTTSGDTVVISGADQPEYNGTFTIANATYTSFTYTIPGNPVSPATGNIIIRQMTDWGQVGWSWSSHADGLGSSLELANPNLPNQYGQNWRDTNTNGTPGRANSVLSSNIAPMILEVQHFPLVPRSTNSIIITARLIDEHTNGLTATLWWRVDALSPPAFSSTPMFDDGAHGDGAAGDGVYGAILAPQANNAVIEFYVQGQDAEANSRTWPAPALDQTRLPIQQANALLQVDNSTANDYAGTIPVYKMIMRIADTNYYLPFPTTAPRSDAAMNTTFITIDGTSADCVYLSDVRDRGAGTRSRQPANHRLAFPDDHQWHGLGSIELNTQYTESQLAGYALSAVSGLNAEWARVVRMRINNNDRASSGSPQFGVYIHLQPTDATYAKTHFPEDPDGNLYRGQAPGILGGTLHNDILAYLGTNGNLYANQGYSKQSGNSDWSDLANLCFVLNTNTPDDNVYAAAVRQVADVDEWMRFFALFTLTLSRETSIATGIGDDYTMYRGTIDSRFQLLAHDWDTILNEGDTTGGFTDSIFRMCPAVNSGANVTFLNRFMRHPQFVPSYYRELYRLATTVFSPAQLGSTLTNALGSFVPLTTVQTMTTFGANRANYVLSQIPLNISVATSLSQSSGYYVTASATVTLNGQANVIDTRSISVNGNTATWSAWEGRWTNTVALQPGVNRVVIQSMDSNSVAFATTNIDIWYNVAGQNVSGAISGSVVWTAAGGPYNVTGALTVGNGATLTIQAGASVFFGSGVTLTVSGSGQVLAQGTSAQHIRLTRVPGGANWGSFDFLSATNESRLAYVDFEFCGGTTAADGHNAQVHVNTGSKVFIDHCTWPPTPVIEYISFNGSSFIVQNCVFPTYPPPTGPESLHGINGIAAGGYGIFRDNYFGHTWGFNDTIDFTGGQRQGAGAGPILQVINNVFDGASDDCLDLDSTDAWIEGNIFIHVHRDPTRTDQAADTASAISGGVDFANQYSDWTLVNNIFFDVDHVFLNKNANNGAGFTGGGRVAMFNNTVVHVNKEYSGSPLSDIGAFDWSDDGLATAPVSVGSGLYAANNIIYDCAVLNVNYIPANYTVIMDNNILSVPWAGPGSGNQLVDPRLNLGAIAGIAFTNVTPAQARLACQLLPGSPAIGAGFGGRDLGGLNPHGMIIAGDPQGTTASTSATLTVGPGGTFNWGTWPAQAWGWTAFKWKLDGGAWSAEIPVTNNSPFTNLPMISLSGLSQGPHTVYVVGKNDAPPGYYQDDTFVYPATAGIPARVSASHTWLVRSNAAALRINEVLARNDSAVPISGKYPDLIELYNSGTATLDLSGMSLSDNASDPKKFVFPANTSLGANQYLVLYAENDTSPPGFHLGFALSETGEEVSLYGADGRLLDSIAFGPQIADYSIGRLADGSWGLCVPSFGAANVAARTGDPHKLKINEWLTDSRIIYDTDFLELYNPESLPVSLAGLYLSDIPIGDPDHHQIAALSFIAANGYAVFQPDGNNAAGPDHLKFKLSPDRGEIALFDSSLVLIDYILYGPQRTDISQGRSPNGSSNIVFLAVATPGSPNPAPVPVGGRLVINEILAKNITGLTNFDGGSPPWLELYNPTNSVDLSDFSLTDDPAQPRKYVFTNGPSLPLGGYLVLFCDANNPASTNNTGFGLKANGGALYLYDKLANGGSLLDGISYGVQANDFSIGRVPDGRTNWVLTVPQPGAHNLQATLGDPMQLMVNEWMANPSSGSDWFELYNPNPQPVALSGLYLSDTLNSPATRLKFKIPPLSFIGTGLYGYERFWADNGAVAGPDHCNFALKASGESVGISLPDGTLINGYDFGAQDSDVSEGRLPDGSANIVRFPTTPTPADANYLPLTDIVINEVLTAWPSNSSLEAAIELHNISTNTVDLSNWYVSNQRRALQKYQFTNVTLQPDGYLVLYQNQLSTSLDPIRRIQLDAINGDQVYLSTAGANNGPLSGYRTSESFGPAEPGVSFGRYLNSQGEEQFVAMSQHTFGVDNPDGVGSFRLGTGLPNAYPLVGPVVLSEIMYHPADLGGLDNVRDEFIELFNITGSTVPLYDPLYPTNTWHVRGGVTFDFPTDVSLAADEFLLVVSFDPNTDATSLAGFRAAYNVSPSVRLYGPYGGKLDNGGEEIHLNKPGAPVSAGQINSGQVPYILVDSVKYNDKAPWPVGADGTGLSLQRFSPTGYGNDPTNWLAGAPSPGLSDSQDRDGDGIPDSWEIANGLNPDDPADANLDPDGDGLTNLQEYQLNTNPHDANSGLRITSTALANGTNMVISFMTLSNYVFTIEYCDSLGLGPWLPLQVVDAAPTNRLVQITVATTAPARFYRLRMSSQAQTAFRIKSIRPLAGSQITLAFDALANQSCALEYTTNLATGPWTTVTNFPAAATNRLIEVVRSASGPSGFYRLRSPADAQASLRFDSIQPLAGGQIALNFGASANQSCTLEYSTNLASSAWTAVTNFPAVATNRSIQVVRPTSGSGGFYRLRSP